MTHEKSTEELIVVELVDVEEFVKRGEEIPHARHYKFRVDDHYYSTEKHQLTGREILQFAGKTPESDNLRQRFRDGKVEKVEPDQVVDLRKHCVERFMTIPKQNTDGEGETIHLRRLLPLSEKDQEYLDANHPHWETISDQGICWLILHDFPIPIGFNLNSAQVAIEIPSGHPLAPIDMVYFYPPLSRADGRAIVAPADRVIEGKTWQRWSRHYAWRVGIDDLFTHIERVKAWLESELIR